jgi:glycosyltransferase involved in cell wall biosynthesis
MQDKDKASTRGRKADVSPAASIAVLIPCYNEAITIKKVVEDFRRALPNAGIYVCDNNSTDGTGALAAEAGAIVFQDPRQGKGYAVRTLFERVDADIYVMVDGDDTYPAEEAVKLIEQVQKLGYDMCVGNRLERYGSGSFRSFHILGNRLICTLINLLFNARLTDILSGYRCFTNRFVKSIPLLKSGFEVETELTLQALDKGFSIVEVGIHYGERPEGSVSKLNTWQDGIIIGQTIFHMLKDYRPLFFFGIMALFFLSVGTASGLVVVEEFMRTGLVKRLPLAVFSVGSVISGIISLAAGIILDTVNLRVKELWSLEMRRNARD